MTYDWKLLGSFDTEEDFIYFRSHYVTSFAEKRSRKVKCKKLCESIGDDHIKKVSDAYCNNRSCLEHGTCTRK
jgi:hypothetical protein